MPAEEKRKNFLKRTLTKLGVPLAPGLPYAENSSPMLATSIAGWFTSITGYLYAGKLTDLQVFILNLMFLTAMRFCVVSSLR